jgi:hypothetical protein
VCGRVLTEGSMWAVRVVVLDELLQHQREVARPGDQKVVEALAAQRLDEALCDRVRPRRPHGGAQDGRTSVPANTALKAGLNAVPVADQEPELLGAVADVQIAWACAPTRRQFLPGRPRAGVVSAQHGEFVTQDQDLDVRGCVGAGDQRQPAQHARERQVRESEGPSGRSCCADYR